MIVGVHLSHEYLAVVWQQPDGAFQQMYEPLVDASVVGGADLTAESKHVRLIEKLEHMFTSLVAKVHARDSRNIRGIVFDVSDVLAPNVHTPLTLVRIAPRPPSDLDHEIRLTERVARSFSVRHVAGGYSALGEELSPLDEAALMNLVESSAPQQRFVVTGVGALITPRHELRAAKILATHPLTAGVELSQEFFSNSFATRERTAVVNSSLISEAVTLGTALGLVGDTLFPNARLYVTTSDGGRVPLTRLTASPVHSLFSGRPSELVGAAHLSGTTNGELLVTTEEKFQIKPDTTGSSDNSAGTLEFVGEVIHGVPNAVSHTPSEPLGVLASQTVNTHFMRPMPLRQLSDSLRIVSAVAPSQNPFVKTTSDTKSGSNQTVVTLTNIDLRALGAALAPLSDWTNRTITASNAEDMQAGLTAAEARVHARLVAAGANPSDVRIVESAITASSYEMPNVVSVRVRGVADTAQITELLPAENTPSLAREEHI